MLDDYKEKQPFVDNEIMDSVDRGQARTLKK